MKQPLKKAVALLLVAVMAMGLLGLSALADNEGGDPGIPAETLEPGPVPDGTTGQEEEPKDPVESEEPETTEPVSETPTTEPEDPNTSETPTTEPEEPRESETPDAGQPVEDITDSEIPLETPDAENKESPELELAEGIISLGVNDTTITISGLLPVRAYFTAFPVDIELEDGEVLAAFDITIYDADGNEWQPDDSVHVSIETPDLEDVDEVTVYHMEDEYATPEMVETVNVAGTTKVEFDAESFSVYVITVQNDGNASNETIYATSKRQPVTVTYLTGSDKQVSWTLKSDSVGKLILSDLTSHGRVDGYYKWTFTATLTEQAQAGTTYSFQMNPNKSGYSATDYKIKASEYTLSDFYYVPGSATQLDDAGHVDIRIDNATYTIKTVIEDSAGNPIGDPTFETIQASIANTKQNPPTIIVNGQSKTSSWIASQGSGNEFRSNLNPRVQIKGLTISAIVNLKETTGAKREFNNVTVIFTEDDMVRAILDCDGYKEQKGKNGVQGLDFTVVANTTFTQTVTAGNGANVPGNITISGTKTWDHGSNSANPLPTNTNLTLTLYKKLSTDTEWTAVTAAPTWNSNTYTFTVPYDSQATEYKVLETVKPENY
ncbi:MAG: hypothetical protein AAGU32_14735, partial [Bacillota bacterium]